MRKSASLLPLAMLSLAPVALLQAAWEVVPEVSLEAGNDDNVLRDTTDEQSATNATADASVTVANFTERSSFTLSPRVVADQYAQSEAKDFNTTDYFLTADGEHAWRRTGVGFRSYYAHQILLNSEFADVAPDDPDLDPGQDFTDPSPDTGRLLLYDATRNRLDISGNVNFTFSERNQFRFELRRQDVSYSGGPTYQSDFKNTDFSVQMIRRVDERNTVSARVIVSQFEAPDRGNTTDTVTVEGSFSRPLAPTWRMYLAAGVERSDFEYLNFGQTLVQNATTSPQLTLGFRKRAQRTRWNIDFSRATVPNGTGFVVSRDNVRLLATHDFTPRLTGQFGARYMRTQPLDDPLSGNDRDFSRVDFSLTYAVKRTMFVYFGYDLLRQKFTELGEDTATSNSIYLGVSYRGRSRRNP